MVADDDSIWEVGRSGSGSGEAGDVDAVLNQHDVVALLAVAIYQDGVGGDHDIGGFDERGVVV